MKTQMRFAADPQKRENPAEPASKACPPALGTHSAPLSVAADPSSAMFLPECSVAQQGIVTASKIASKNRLFQQRQSPPAMRKACRPPSHALLKARFRAIPVNELIDGVTI